MPGGIGVVDLLRWLAVGGDPGHERAVDLQLPNGNRRSRMSEESPAPPDETGLGGHLIDAFGGKAGLKAGAWPTGGSVDPEHGIG